MDLPGAFTYLFGFRLAPDQLPLPGVHRKKVTTAIATVITLIKACEGNNTCICTFTIHIPTYKM